MQVVLVQVPAQLVALPSAITFFATPETPAQPTEQPYTVQFSAELLLEPIAIPVPVETPYTKQLRALAVFAQ